MNITNLPKLEQLYPLIKWQLFDVRDLCRQVTIVGLTHHPYFISNIEQQTLLSFFQEDHLYHCQLCPGLEIICSQHSDYLYIFSFSLDKEFINKQYKCPF